MERNVPYNTVGPRRIKEDLLFVGWFNKEKKLNSKASSPRYFLKHARRNEEAENY